MAMNRRQMLQWLGGAYSALALRKFARSQQAAQGGPFAPTRESLQAYKIPDWFRDAKFGIWAHWGPQSAIEDGDWYARNMYVQDQPQYLYHCETYGHPSKVGYKDLVNIWKAEKMHLNQLTGLNYLIHDLTFHRVIAQASGNPILAAINETITSALYDARRKTVERSTDLRESAEMHRELYRAIRSRKPQEAHNLMEQHLRMAQIAQGMERPTGRKASQVAVKKRPTRSASAA